MAWREEVEPKLFKNHQFSKFKNLAEITKKKGGILENCAMWQKYSKM